MGRGGPTIEAAGAWAELRAEGACGAGLAERGREGRARQVDAVEGEGHHVGSGDGRGVGEAVDAAAKVGHARGRLGGAAEGKQEALAARVAPRYVEKGPPWFGQKVAEQASQAP